MISAIKASHFVYAHAAYIGGCFQLPAEIVSPLVIRAPNHQTCITGFGDQLHTAVATHIVKHPCAPELVTHHDQWQSHKRNRVDATGLGNVAAESQSCPGLSNNRIALFQPVVVVGVSPIGKCCTLSNRWISRAVRADVSGGGDGVSWVHISRHEVNGREFTPA